MSGTILGRKIDQRKWPGAFHWLVTGLTLGLLLAAAACASATQPSAQPASSAADPTIGPLDASVTIVEYGDFG